MPTLQAVRSWGTELDQVAERIGIRFGRRDLRAHAGRYLRGLISRVQRKNGWHQHITLSMLAYATLVVLRERIRSAPSKKVNRSFLSRSRRSAV